MSIDRGTERKRGRGTVVDVTRPTDGELPATETNRSSLEHDRDGDATGKEIVYLIGKHLPTRNEGTESVHPDGGNKEEGEDCSESEYGDGYEDFVYQTIREVEEEERRRMSGVKTGDEDDQGPVVPVQLNQDQGKKGGQTAKKRDEMADCDRYLGIPALKDCGCGFDDTRLRDDFKEFWVLKNNRKSTFLATREKIRSYTQQFRSGYKSYTDQLVFMSRVFSASVEVEAHIPDGAEESDIIDIGKEWNGYFESMVDTMLRKKHVKLLFHDTSTSIEMNSNAVLRFKTFGDMPVADDSIDFMNTFLFHEFFASDDTACVLPTTVINTFFEDHDGWKQQLMFTPGKMQRVKACETLYIPIIRNSHWYLAVITQLHTACQKGEEGEVGVYIMDSFPERSDDELLEERIRFRLYIVKGGAVDWIWFEKVVHVKVPDQKTTWKNCKTVADNSCGFRLVWHMLLFRLTNPSDGTRNDFTVYLSFKMWLIKFPYERFVSVLKKKFAAVKKLCEQGL